LLIPVEKTTLDLARLNKPLTEIAVISTNNTDNDKIPQCKLFLQRCFLIEEALGNLVSEEGLFSRRKQSFFQ
jgi:hypothetical protein